MRIHHLDCCTMCPAAGRLVNSQGRMVAHCLLIETPRDGLVLVDTGIGLDDVANPRARLGGFFMAMTGARVDPANTAAAQVEKLGFSRKDVRHIVPTHLDLDHAGGLADFPDALVHVHTSEHDAALGRRTLRERERYRACHFAHGPRWSVYDAREGDAWFGFQRVRAHASMSAEIYAVPLAGHTRGHVAVAVRDDAGWLLHAGDAYFHEGQVDPARGRPGFGAVLFERSVAMDYARVRDNHARLRALHAAHGDEVRVFSAHDPAEFERARSARAVRVDPRAA